MGLVEVREKRAPRQKNTRSSDKALEIGLYVFAVLMLIVLIYLMPVGIVGGVYYLVHSLRSSFRSPQAKEQAAQRASR